MSRFIWVDCNEDSHSEPRRKEGRQNTVQVIGIVNRKSVPNRTSCACLFAHSQILFVSLPSTPERLHPTQPDYYNTQDGDSTVTETARYHDPEGKNLNNDHSKISRTDMKYVRFEVFTAVTMKNGVFWDVTPGGSCKNRCFGGM
jgi:hypothetical protein